MLGSSPSLGAVMSNKSLNPLDASWLMVESRNTPMHVGGLITFTLPEDAPPDFLRELISVFRTAKEVAAPWNHRLRKFSWKHLLPVWEEVEELDLEHHVRLSALPKPGGERELGQLIARLHSQPLDLTRPPWECELIEGMEPAASLSGNESHGRRFAIYIKMHHSLIDGISGMKLLVRSMSNSQERSRDLPPFWTVGLPPRERRSVPPPSAAQVLNQVVQSVRSQAGSLPDIVRAFGSMYLGRNKLSPLSVPFDTPISIINGRVSGPRRFATQQFALARLKALAEQASCTLNDIVLAICGAALRRFLLELDELPDKSLTAGIPVSVRPKDDEGAGNAITFIISTLGTDLKDARARLEAIRASTRRAKEHVLTLPKKAMMQYTMVLMAPYMLTLLTGMGGRTRPMFNITISNVPGPEQPLYFRGARMEASFPVSLVSHGQALNITCQSYAGTIAFGFTGCRDTLPHMQRIATYTGEALAELEAVFAPVPEPVRKARVRKAASPAIKPVAVAQKAAVAAVSVAKLARAPRVRRAPAKPAA